MPRKDLPTSQAFLDWQAATDAPDEAALCLRYALMFNQLDAEWLDGALAADVSYASQSVFDVLEGREAVRDYLRGKLATLCRSPGSRVRAELASLPQGGPCVAMFQARDSYHGNWLEEAQAATTFTADNDGRAAKILMITVAPSPASVRRSGIYPGVEAPVTESPKRFIRPQADYQGLRFEVFLLNGETELDHEMQRRMQEVLECLPAAQSREFVWQTMEGREYDHLDRAGFNGFPAVAAYWQENLIHSCQGLIETDAYIRAVQGATTMHVVRGNQT